MKKQKYFLQGAIVVFTFFGLPCTLLVNNKQKANDKGFNSSQKVEQVNKCLPAKQSTDNAEKTGNEFRNPYFPFPVIGPCIVFITPAEK